jgi:1-acyl-sn-glycerol-3-phosphate acyltransferase
MYATSMKDRIVAAAKTKAREIQEAARPGTAVKELEDALDAGEGKVADGSGASDRDAIEDATADIEPADRAAAQADDEGEPGARAAS